MDHCGTWTSSYRLVLALLEEIDAQPYFSPNELLDGDTVLLKKRRIMHFGMWFTFACLPYKNMVGTRGSKSCVGLAIP